jgi:hypothetical protein
VARLGLPAALALAIVSAIVALLLLPRGHHASPTELAFMAVAVPALLAPLFWPRECPSGQRLLVSALGPVAAFIVTCSVLMVLHGAVAPQGVVLASLVAVLMLAVLHQLAALIEPVVRRLGASEASAREWSLWSVTALLWLAAAAPAWLGPAADLGARTDPRWPSFIFGSSPLAHLASASGYDVLRGQWFYAHSSLGALQVDYPRVATLLVTYAFALVALTLLGRAEVRMLRALALLAVLGAASDAARSATPLDLEAVPAWGGWTRPGRITELDVRLRSQQRDSVRVTLNSGSSRIRTVVQLEPGQQSSSAIPVRAAEVIGVGVGRARDLNASRTVRLALSESPLLAWAAGVSPPGELGGFHAVMLEPGQLPRTSSAYSSIDALVIDRRVVAALGQQQLAALLAYLSGCGRTVLISATSRDEGLFRSVAGCGGRGFAVATNEQLALTQLAGILAAPSADTPEPAALASVMGPDLRSWNLVAASLALCAAAIVILGIFTSSLLAAVAVPALLTAAALGLVQTRSPMERLTVWAEAGAGERIAQYRGLQQVTGLRRGRAGVRVLDVLARPAACRADDSGQWTWDAVARRYSSVHFDSRLFAGATLCYAGEFPVAREAAVRAMPQGRLLLANAGASGLPAGKLAWNGRLFEVDVLAAGQQVELDPAQGSTPADGAEALALARTPVDAQAVLWPLELQRVAGAPAQSQAWLLVSAARNSAAVNQ